MIGKTRYISFFRNLVLIPGKMNTSASGHAEEVPVKTHLEGHFAIVHAHTRVCSPAPTDFGDSGNGIIIADFKTSRVLRGIEMRP